MRLKSLVFFLFCSCWAFAEESYWDKQLVRSYVHNSELQRRWAWSFLAPHLKKLTGFEHILDIGCGDGKITADLSCFVSEGLVVGIDPSYDMLNWARKQYPPEDYSNLLFQIGTFSQPAVTETFDLIVSFCALHHESDPFAGILRAKQYLKPGGKLLILVPSLYNPSWAQAGAKMRAKPKWAPYWKDFTPRRFLSGEQYKQFLEEIGFQKVVVRLVETKDAFIDQEEWIRWFQGTFPACVPSEQSYAFYEEWIQEQIQIDPSVVGEDGVLYAHIGYIQIEAE